MTSEAPSFQESLRCYYWDDYSIRINVEGNILDNKKYWWLQSPVLEILNNCARNRMPEDPSEGPKNISISVLPGELIVKDDFVYDNAEEVVNRLNAIVASGKLGRTNRQIGEKTQESGAGIIIALFRLKSMGGSLSYRAENGTVVTVMTWNDSKEYSFENEILAIQAVIKSRL